MSFPYQLINGRNVPAGQALIPITDLGLLRAYAVFDYFRVLQGVPVFVDDHIDRLLQSAAMMEIVAPWSHAQLKGYVSDLIAANKAGDAGCRLVITGGYAEDGYSPSAPNIYGLLHTLPEYAPAQFRDGARLISAEYMRDVPEVKSCNYIRSIRLRDAVRAADAVEILYHWQGRITECSRSNVFFVTADDVLVTPDADVLRGVTRRHVLALAKAAGIHIEERTVHFDETGQMAQAFISSSTKGVMPIIQIDDNQIGDGRPGQITRFLQQAFTTHVTEIVAGAGVQPVGG